jgi:hypothetical protein
MSNVTSNDITDYSVVVSDFSGSVTSSVVTLAVVYSVPPLALIVTNGNPASFAVAAYGSGVFGYQWYFNTNAAISGATNANLVITNADESRAGSYDCVITNTYGSVTSAMATLAVVLRPSGLSASRGNGNQLTLRLSGSPGFPYVLQATTNLMLPITWQAVCTNPADGEGNWSCTVSNLSAPRAFYRAVAQ